MSTFKNALCLAGIPEEPYTDLGMRYRRCQRKKEKTGAD